MSSFAVGSIKPLVVFASGRAPHVPSLSPARLTTGRLALESVGRSQRTNFDRFTRQRLETQFDDRATNLKTALDRFVLPEAENLHLAKSVVSTNERVVSGQAANDATPARHRVQFSQPARAQENRSVQLTPTEAPTLGEGTYTFDLSVGGDTHTLEVEVKHSGYTGQADTNLSLLNKIARAVNAADSRVQARVVEAEKSAYSDLPGGGDLTEKVAWLSITSQDTGDEAPFSLEDKTGALVATYQLSRQDPSGSRAVWRLGGVPQDSPDNDPRIDGGQVTLHLNYPAPDYETLTVTEGLAALAGDTARVLSAYNNLMFLMALNQDQITSGLADTFRRETAARRSTLEEIGLTVTDGGLVAIGDRFAVQMATNYAEVKETLTGEAGLFTTWSRLADQVVQNGVGKYFKPAEDVPAYSASTLARSFNQTRQGFGLISLIV
ncbi:MAG: hypothetical protein KJ621_01700 [Proteobacteria bacterium]|nr:hypothetical protein [Pseudomonadota bacterium]